MRVETYQMIDWEEPETGLLIDENEEWVLVKHIPVDYVIDGYKLYKKEYIQSRGRGESEQKIEKVLLLKKVDTKKPDGFEFSDTAGLLQWVERTYGLFEFQDEEESEVTYGRINTLEGGNLTIDMIDADGAVEEAAEFDNNIHEIRIITFGTDYHISIGLLWKDRNKK